MENLELIKEAFDECAKEDSWVNFINFGSALNKKGVDYKKDYPNLSAFIKSNKNVFRWKADESGPIVKLLVKLKEQEVLGKVEIVPTVVMTKHVQEQVVEKGVPQRAGLEEKYVIKNKPRTAIHTWAIIPKYPEALKQLSELALAERWYYHEQETANPLPILDNYLRYTFWRLQQEGGKILEEGDCACFNTGLVDKRYEPIYASFKKVKAKDTGEDKWMFLAFCIAGEDTHGKNLVRNFKDLPEGPHYFKNTADVIYDAKSQPQLDIEHIIIENTDRLPESFLADHWPSGFARQDHKSFSTIFEKKEYYSRLGRAIKSDSKVYRSISNRIKDAVILAVKRVQWNFKTAIPVYFPVSNEMSLLLPLSLIDDEQVDIALVVERQKSGNYLGHTIIPLDWAYKCARLVCRPDSDWLAAADILVNDAAVGDTNDD